ncbi:MAG: DNA-processing protein DprA, partial [bacterium]|nr:DNA-processing protein DprA [bacterium]
AVLGGTDARFAELEAERAARHGVRLMTLWDADYPELLRAAHDAPVLLYVKGPLDWSRFNGIAVVGTRFPTSTGREVAGRISEQLSAAGLTVVSGLARGVDTAAHRGALRGAGSTVAVTGSGVDVVYPPENRRLYLDILERGAVVSEFFMGAPPEASHFPRRNRIISGLCKAVLVVEAGEKSGALLTADIALEQNRDVFAVPGSVASPKSAGTNRLIQSGAKLVASAEDVLSEYPEIRRSRTPATAAAGAAPSAETGLLSPAEKTLWDGLSSEPEHIDRIASENRLAVSEALAMLLSMELKSCVKQLTGMRFARVE